jgi:glycosyltransferase involved in cell wall biosynthesis
VIATILRPQGDTGVQTHFNTFANYLKERGIGVSIATPFGFPKVILYPVFGIRKVIDPLSGGGSVWWYRYWHYFFLSEVLKGYASASGGEGLRFYAQCPLSARACLEVRRSPKQRVFLAVHFNVSQADEWAEKGKIRKTGELYRKIREFERMVIPRVDGIIYVSNYMKEAVEAAIPEARGGNSIVLPNFLPTPVDEPQLMDGDLVSIGTLEPRKNQEYLLQVLLECRNLGRQYRLTLIGDGPDRNRLERIAEEFGLKGQIAFLGARKQASRYLNGHRVFVHSAKMENLPIAIIEAYARGLPVFAAPVGGVPEILTDGVEGCFWPLNDPKGGAKRLIGILDDAEIYARMSREARRRFNRSFESDQVASRLVDLLCGE